MSNNTETFIIKINDKGVVSGLRKAEDATDRVHKKTNGLNTAFRALGGIMAGISIGYLGSEVISTLAEFEKFEAVLTNTFGSNSKAKQALADITEFASKTPFAVDELSGAFVKLANRGFAPTVTELTKLGDLASSTGKGFDQLAEALMDAETGEFERLKEFGIKASKNGDRVAFTFKGVTQEVNYTEKAMRDYILSLGDVQGVSGGMAAISKTTGGLISNLKDDITQLYLTIGQKLKPEIAGTIGALKGAVNVIKDFVNWITSGSTSAEIFIAVVAGLTAGIILYNAVVQAQILWTKAATAAQWLYNAALTANPIGIVVGAIAVLVTAVVVAWKRFDKFRAVIKGTWAAMKSIAKGIKDDFLSLPDLIIKAFKSIPTAIMQSFSSVGKIIKAVTSGNLSDIPNIIADFAKNNAVSQALADKERVDPAKAAGKAFADAYNDEMSKSAQAKKQKAEDEKAINEQKVDFEGSTVDPTGGKGGKLGAGLSEVRASAPKTFNINIESLIKEQNINTTNLRESTQKIKEEITRVLLTAVNDSQIIAE